MRVACCSAWLCDGFANCSRRRVLSIMLCAMLSNVLCAVLCEVLCAVLRCGVPSLHVCCDVDRAECSKGAALHPFEETMLVSWVGNDGCERLTTGASRKSAVRTVYNVAR